MSNVIEPTTAMTAEISVTPVGERAGFWRRAFAFLIDTLVVTVAVQLVVVFLFSATSGRVQILGDLNYTTCSDLKSVPDGLVPPPPEGVNYARECSVTFFGAPTAKILQVGRSSDSKISRNGQVEKKTVKEILAAYSLDRDGRQINGTTLEWVVGLLLMAYVIVMETQTGATFGNRAMGIRLVDAARQEVRGVPLRKVVTRYAALLIGTLPILCVSLLYFGLYAAPGEFATWLSKLTRQQSILSELRPAWLQWQPFLASYLLDLPGKLLRSVAGDLGRIEWLYEVAAQALNLWGLYIAVQIVRRRDPVYDRIAGTSVIRV